MHGPGAEDIEFAWMQPLPQSVQRADPSFEAGRMLAVMGSLGHRSGRIDRPSEVALRRRTAPAERQQLL
jgi:hypothetical protein